MKELQDDFTTPEQSKRLLELGIPVDSANMLYCRCVGELWGDPQLCHRKYSEYSVDSSFEMLPCWSAGRLMEIFDMCCVSEKISKEKWCSYREILQDQTYLDYILFIFTVTKGRGFLDFSRLNEYI